MHLVIFLLLKSREELYEKVVNGQVLPEHPLLESEEANRLYERGQSICSI